MPLDKSIIHWFRFREKKNIQKISTLKQPDDSSTVTIKILPLPIGVDREFADVTDLRKSRRWKCDRRRVFVAVAWRRYAKYISTRVNTCVSVARFSWWIYRDCRRPLYFYARAKDALSVRPPCFEFAAYDGRVWRLN